MNVAILGDYQNVALKMAHWSSVARQAKIIVFNDHLADPDAVVERLLPFDVICVMRERTPLPRAVIERLPQLKLIASTGSRNASIDMATADERGIQVTATGYRSTPTIEMTWALILVSARHIVRESNSVRDGGWQTSVDRELDGAGRAGPGQYRRTSRAYPRLAAAPSVHLPELSPGAAARGMTSLLRPCFSSPQVL